MLVPHESLVFLLMAVGAAEVAAMSETLEAVVYDRRSSYEEAHYEGVDSTA
jgi:hypothetical protein